ncbi:MAG: hypothetical protein DRQ51_03815 [Gammaproteobacteria bacterium]|nr:MAG: hypothetical protein DRQ51_03815 [Gammaproteobacteria bacterium]
MNIPVYSVDDFGCDKYKFELSEAHGILTALILGDSDLKFVSWIEEIMSNGIKIDKIEKKYLQSLAKLHIFSVYSLGQQDYSYQLFLPDDNSNLRDRIKNLSFWCDGFMYGIGLTVATNKKKLSSQSDEFLKDVLHVCRLNDADDNESDENSFIEICEYIKTGIYILQLDLK